MKRNLMNICLAFLISLCCVSSSNAQSFDPGRHKLNAANGHYYEQVYDNKQWEEASFIAESRWFDLNGVRYTGHLATITSQSEHDYIITQFPDSYECWLGGYQINGSVEPSGGWYWVTGEDFSLYQNWAPGEPNNAYAPHNLQKYLKIWGGYKWDDDHYYYGHKYIVEYEPNPTEAVVKEYATANWGHNWNVENIVHGIQGLVYENHVSQASDLENTDIVVAGQWNSFFKSWILEGGILIVHDWNRTLTSFPGLSVAVLRSYNHADINVIDANHRIVNGIFGTINNVMLDNGNSSIHGAWDKNSLNTSSDPNAGPVSSILSSTDPTAVAVLEYSYGKGHIIYANIPLEAYTSSVPLTVGEYQPAGLRVYAKNELHYAKTLVNHPPIIWNDIPNFSMLEEGQSTTDLNATDNDGDTLTWSILTQGSKGTASVSGNGIGGNTTVTYTPDANITGVDSFVVQVSDGNGGTDTLTFTVTVLPVNDAPSIQNDVPVFSQNEDTSSTTNLSAIDVDGDTLTWSILTQGTLGTASVSGNGIGNNTTVSYTPYANETGVDTFEVQVSDGNSGTRTLPFTITILPVNDAPYIVYNNTFSIPEGQSGVITYDSLLVKDYDQEAPGIVYTLVAAPSHGILSKSGIGLAANGTFTQEDINNGLMAYAHDGRETTSDSFLFIVVDGQGAALDATSFHIEVTPVNDPPVAHAGGPYSVNEGDTVNLDAALSSDVDGTIVSYSWDTNGDGVTDLNTASPLASFPALDDAQVILVLRVIDDGSEIHSATASLLILNVIPVADAGGPYATTEGSEVVLSGSTIDPGNDTHTFEWDLDYDGVTFEADAVGETVNHTWNENGTYTVALRVTDDDGGVSDIVTTTVMVTNAAPVVNAGADQTVLENATVTFNGSYSDAGSDDTHTVNWNYGNGSDATDPSPALNSAHDYGDRNGDFTVTLTVTDDDGGVGLDTLTITVLPVNDAPSFVKGADQTVTEGEDAQIVSNWATAGSVGPANEADQTFSFVVNADDTALFFIQPSLTPSGNLVYTPSRGRNGTTLVQVLLKDDGGTDNGGSDTAPAQTFSVTVVNAAPVVNAGEDQASVEGQAVSLLASYSDAGLDDTHTAVVDWGDGSPAESGAVDAGLKTVSASHTFTNDGTYSVTVTVTDNDGGSHSDSLVVTVANAAPVLAQVEDQASTEGAVFNPAGLSFTDAGIADVHTATVDWGDGSALEAAGIGESAGSGTVSGSHTYADNGSYTVTVTVSDDAGDNASISFAVTVANAAPVVLAGDSQAAQEGSAVALSATYSDAGLVDTHSASINWGDGSAVEAVALPQGAALNTLSGSHVYADDGTYTVTVTVTDDDSGVGSDSFTVTVSNAAPLVLAGNDQTVEEGAWLYLDPASFIDPGTLDTHSAKINWGDGGAEETFGVMETPFGPPGSTVGLTGQVAASHIYQDNGVYTATVTVTDDEGESASDSLQVTVTNARPVVSALGAPVLNENDTLNLGVVAFSDAGTLDTHSATIDWGDGSAVEAVTVTQGSGEGSLTGNHTYRDDGVYTVTVTVTDNDGGSGTSSTLVTVNNVAPVVAAGSDQSSTEGSEVSLSGASFSDAGEDDTHTASIDWGDGTVTPGAIALGLITGSHTYADNGEYTVTVTVTDDDGGAGSNSFSVSVANAAPVVNAINATLDPIAVGTVFTANASFTDAGVLDIHTAVWNWGDGTTSPGSVQEANGTKTVSGSHVYATPGVYVVSLTVTDNGGGMGSRIFEYAVVYDTAAGFVTGGGWILSPAGAYTLEPTLSGKANFGFVSKYQKGANVPTGNTEFQFKAGNFTFKSTEYEWLVVAGANAKYKGSGTVNGQGDYGFMLTAVDGQVNGGGGVDKFRIKVWDKVTGAVVYDNQPGETDDSYATTELSGGSIVVHTK